jgi:hypothetical protein
VVVRATGEEDFAGVELVQRAGDGPDVDGGVMWESEDYTLARSLGHICELTDFRSTVKSRYEVRGDLSLRHIGGGTQVTHFQRRLVLGYLQVSKGCRERP